MAQPTARSRYRPDTVPDYSHRFHAGNVGDVWKHCALLEVLRGAAAHGGPVHYVETHAGEGGYALGPTGEWSEGIGRLWAAPDRDGAPDGLARYLSLCRRLGRGGERPTRYPGSPAFARAALGADAPLLLWERDQHAWEQLTAHAAGDPHTLVIRGDGLQALDDTLATLAREPAPVVVFVDPPYTHKSDWVTVPDALVRAAAAAPHACLMLWYPVKSLTRPNAMIARLEAAAVPGTVAELVTTPLEHQRQRLNGSGVLLVRPPASVLAALAATAPVIGAHCATHAGTWSFRMRSW